MKHPKVLIADDDRSITEGLSAILRDEGYDVAVALDGQKALGPFKKRFWELPSDVKTRLSKAYEEKFSFLFTQLGVANTRDVVDRFVKPIEQHKPQPHPDLAVVEAAPDDADLSD